MRRLLGVLGVALLVFTACGSDDDSPTVGTPSGQSSQDDHDHGGGKDKCGEATTKPTVVAKTSLAFENDCLSVPAGTAFTLTFENGEEGTTHNVAVLKAHTDPAPLFKTEIAAGPNSRSVAGGPLEAGTYHFHCEVHPTTMQGTLKVV